MQQTKNEDYYTILLREMSDLREQLSKKDETIRSLRDQLMQEKHRKSAKEIGFGGRKSEDLSSNETASLKQEIAKLTKKLEDADVENVRLREKVDSQVSIWIFLLTCFRENLF